MDSNFAPIRAVSDGEDRLISADPAVERLQLACGGSVPGAIAIPELRALVRKSRRFGLKLARGISAQDGTQAVRVWAEVEPGGDADDGCTIIMRNWQVTPLSPEAPLEMARQRGRIDREVAELTARLDAAQCLLSVDAEAADLAEVARAMREGIGRPWTDFVEIPGNGHEQPMHWRLLDGVELRIAGSRRPWRASLFPQHMPGEKPRGFELCFTSDQPPPQSATAHVPASPRKAGGSYLAFVGQDVAPVLRQPINRIIANAETIRTRLAGPIDDIYANYASDIAAAGQHLLQLLEDLSTLEVMESAEFSPAPDHIDLAEVARQAAGILGVRARERDIAIDVPRAGESLPAIGEFRRVLQILLNLIGNAIHYTPEGSQIWLRLERVAQAGAELARIVVADQGQGFSAEDCDKVFAKFERLGRSGDGGSGLGLYISRRLARAMGGDLTVESAPGQGARFILDLPADTVPPAAQDEASHDRGAGDTPERSAPGSAGESGRTPDDSGGEEARPARQGAGDARMERLYSRLPRIPRHVPEDDRR